MSRYAEVTIRLELPPDDVILIVRGGERGLLAEKVRDDAERSRAIMGILGISVQSSMPGETLADMWSRSRVLRGRDVVWWSTVGRLRYAGFPVLPTGRDERHFTVVLAHLEDASLGMMGELFTRAQQ